MALTPAKLFKEYSDLVNLLESRGMNISDRARAERKISQVGYYRLSGFWYPSRKIEVDQLGEVIKQNGKPKRSNDFLPDTEFDDIFTLYVLKNGREIPIWVAVEAWSFGTLSKYYELLKGQYQNSIASRLGVSNASLLTRWLQDINILRNRCAHHTRVWNQSQNNPLGIPTGTAADAVYFSQFNLNQDQRKKIYSLMTLIWFLVKGIGPNSNWNLDLIHEITTLPTLPFCPLSAMGIPTTEPLLDTFSKA